jgi:hypothetical protein
MEKRWYRRKRVWLGIILALCIALTLAKDHLLTKILQVYLTSALEKNGWHFEEIQADQNYLTIESLSKDGCSIAKAEISCHLSLIPFVIDPHVVLSQVSITLRDEEEGKNQLTHMGVILGEGIWQPKVWIQGGKIQTSFAECAFEFTPGENKHKIGCFLLREMQKEQSFLQADIHRYGKEITAQVQISEGNLSFLYPWIRSSIGKWDKCRGEVSAYLQGTWNVDFGLSSLQANLSLANVHLYNAVEECDIQAKMLESTLSFMKKEDVPLWRQTDLFVTFEEMACTRKGKLGVIGALGEMRIHPKEDPYLKATGTLMTSESYIPFEFEGSGELLEKKSYWLQTNLSFFLPKGPSQCFASFWQDEVGEATLEVQCEQVGKEFSLVYQELREYIGSPRWQIEKGEIGGKLLCSFSKNVCTKCEFSDCSAKNISFVMSNPDVKCEAQNLTWQGKIDSGVLSSLAAKIHKGKVSIAGEKLDDVIAQIEIVDGAFLPSYLESSYKGAKVAAQILGAGSESIVHLECGLQGDDLQRWFALDEVKIASKDPIFFVADLYPLDQTTRFTATARLPVEEDRIQDIDIQGFFAKNLSRKMQDIFSPWDLSSVEGIFETEQLSSKAIFGLLPQYKVDFPLEGSCQLKGAFSAKEVFLELAALEVSMSAGPYKIMGQLGDKAPIALCYDRKSGHIEGEGSIDTLLIEDRRSGVSIEVVETPFFIEQGKVWSRECVALVEGIPLSGAFTYAKDALVFHTGASEMDFSSLTSLIEKYLPGVHSLPLEGKISVEDKGGVLRLYKEEGNWICDWSLSAFLSQGIYPLGPIGAFDALEARISIGSSQELLFEKIRGRYVGNNFTCDIKAQDMFFSKTTPVAIAIKGEENAREVFAFIGSLTPRKEGWLLEVKTQTHFLGIECLVDPINIGSGASLLPITVSCHYHWDYLPAYISFFRKLGFDVPSYQKALISGESYLRMKLDGKKAIFHLETPSFVYEGTKMGKLECDLSWEKGLCKVHSCQLGAYRGAFEARKKEDQWVLQGVNVSFPEGKVVAEGKYDPKLCKLFLPTFSFLMQTQEIELEGKGGVLAQISEEGTIVGEGNLEKLTAKKDALVCMARKGTRFRFSRVEGVVLEKSQWNLLETSSKQSIANMTFSSLRYLINEQKLFIEEGQMKVMKELFSSQKMTPSVLFKEKEIVCAFDAIVSKEYKKIVAQVKQGGCDLYGVALDVKQLQLLQEKDRIYVICQALCEGKAIQAQWHSRSDFSDAALTLKEETVGSGLTFRMKKLWQIEEAEGAFCGCALKMQKAEESDKKTSTYNVQLKVDPAQMLLFLPVKTKEAIKKWKIGSGYEFSGVVSIDPHSFHVIAAKGRLFGNKFICLGRALDSFSTKLHFTKDLIQLQDLLLEDDAGCLFVKNLEVRAHPETRHWKVTAPLVRIKDFSPTLLIKGTKGGPLIKNISLYDLKGLLHDMYSFEGSGALNFVTPVNKKEVSFWDIPLNMMKDFGLDTSILTPTIGEADFILSQGRCYFTALKNMYSEGERSQFHLANSSQDAYLSLDGTWHVDLKMKQNVVWKVTEDLVLSVRGTLEKPKYSFKLRKENSN